MDLEGGDRVSGPPAPLKNHKNIGFLSNTGPDPLKKATKPALLCVLPNFAIILTRKRELIVLL